MFETFDHTADVGLRVRAANLTELMTEAARALFSLIVANPQDIQPSQCVAISLEADEPDYLLFDWLSELLYMFDAQRLVFATFDVTLSGGKLEAVAHGEPLDPTRHVLEHEVKAITYHGLRVEPTSDGWLAEVIVDI